MFEQLEDAIREDTVKYCYGVTINTGTERRAVVTGGRAIKSDYEDTESAKQAQSRGGQPGSMPREAAKETPARKQTTVRRAGPKVGRNDPCPCGSGKKYKNCCMKKDLGLVDDPFTDDK